VERALKVDLPQRTMLERLVGGNMDVTNGWQAKVIEWRVNVYVQGGIRGVGSGGPEKREGEAVVVVVVGRQSLGEQASSWLRCNTV